MALIHDYYQVFSVIVVNDGCLSWLEVTDQYYFFVELLVYFK